MTSPPQAVGEETRVALKVGAMPTQAVMKRFVARVRACEIPVKGMRLNPDGSIETLSETQSQATMSPEEELAQWMANNENDSAT